MKTIRLNEQDLNNLVERIIKEEKSQGRFHSDLMDLLDRYQDLNPSQILEVLQNQVSVYRAEVSRMKRGMGPISADDVVKNFQEDYMADSDNKDEFQWAKDSLKSGVNSFDWLRERPLESLVGIRFEWAGNEYEITDAFDASEPLQQDEDGNYYENEWGEQEEGIMVKLIDLNDDDDDEYSEPVPLDVIIMELNLGVARLINA